MDWHAADLLPQPPDAAWRMAAGIAIVLLLATLVARLLRLRLRLARRQPHALLDNLNQRIDTWWLIAIAVGLALLAGRPGVIVLFALASLAALREFLAGDVAAAIPRALRWSGFAIILPLQYLLLFAAPGPLFASLIPLCVLLVLPGWEWLHAAHDGPPRRLRPLQLGLLLCVYAISHVPALLTLPVDAGDTQRNGWLLVFLLLVVQVGDVLQYLWGKLAGRHQIAPRLSPAKTVEGTVGGILSACALGAWLAPLTPFTTAAAAMISLLLGVLGFVGGLLLSALKRQRGIKDWGTLLPGHGGMLDRLDSLCLSAPVFYYLLR